VYDSYQNKRGDPGAHGDRDRELALGQKPLGIFAAGNRHFAIVLDHAHEVVTKFSEIGGHCVFAGEPVAVYDELLFHRALVQRFFISHADIGRQFGRTGIFLAVVANLALQRDAHCWPELIAIHLPAPLARPLLC
jgi:hypothetical protein